MMVELILEKLYQKKLPLGKKVEFTVMSETRRSVKISKPTVSIACGSAKKEYPVHSVRKNQGNWVIAFTPICGGQNSLSVSVQGGKVEGNPFQFTVQGTPQRGAVVMRGPDWRYGDIDGGTGNLGTIGNTSNDLHNLSVTWDSTGASYRFRWGTDNEKYDVVLVP